MQTLPGFNAEASLYRSGGHYRRYSSGNHRTGGATAIQPALDDTCSGGGATCHCAGGCVATGTACTCDAAE